MMVRVQFITATRYEGLSFMITFNICIVDCTVERVSVWIAICCHDR